MYLIGLIGHIGELDFEQMICTFFIGDELRIRKQQIKMFEKLAWKNIV